MSQPQSREAVVAAVESYIFKGLRDQQPDQVLLADDCVRIELGMNTGRDGAHIRELLASSVYDAVLDCFDLNWTVEGDQACVFYKQKLSFAETPALIATRFVVTDGKIAEIEILFFNLGMMDVSAEAVKELSEA